MVDPSSLVPVTANSEADGKFVVQARNQGEKWVAGYFKDHAPKAIEKAKQNSSGFLVQLSQRVKLLEEGGEQQRELIEDSLNHPDFSILLQKAMISSAQTEDNQKHELIARLVADRLSKGPETLFALMSQAACEAISKMNTTQMKILGCLATVHFMRPEPLPPTPIEDKALENWWVKWFSEKLIVYQDLAPAKMDYLHLESLSCIEWSEKATYDYGESVHTPANVNPYAFTRTKLGGKIFQLWYGNFREAGLGSAFPTSTGTLIGIYVSDMLLGTTTALDEWERS